MPRSQCRTCLLPYVLYGDFCKGKFGEYYLQNYLSNFLKQTSSESLKYGDNNRIAFFLNILKVIVVISCFLPVVVWFTSLGWCYITTKLILFCKVVTTPRSCTLPQAAQCSPSTGLLLFVQPLCLDKVRFVLSNAIFKRKLSGCGTSI